MTSFDYSGVMWAEATRDYDAEETQELQLRGKLATASFWPFLAAAESEADFGHRLVLIEDRIAAVVAPPVLDSVLASVASDWKLLHTARLEASAQAEQERLRQAEAHRADQPQQVRPDDEIFDVSQGRWVRVSYIDPSDAQRYSHYPNMNPPVDNGPLQGPDGFVTGGEGDAGRSDAVIQQRQLTPGQWTVTPGTEWPVRPNAADPTQVPRTAQSQGRVAGQWGYQGDWEDQEAAAEQYQRGAADAHNHRRSGEDLRAEPNWEDQNYHYKCGYELNREASRRQAGEGIAPTPGPNPNYFSQGSEGIAGPPTFPENPSSAIEPKTDNRMDDLYGAVPPQASSGSAQGLVDGQGYSKQVPGSSATAGRRPFDRTAAGFDDGHVHWYVTWAQGQGHDPDEVSTLKKYQKEPGVGRAHVDHIADQLYIGGGDSDWRKAAGARTAGGFGGSEPTFKPGDRVQSFRGEGATVHRIHPSQDPGKSHRVQVRWDDPERNLTWDGQEHPEGAGDQQAYYEHAFSHHPDTVGGIGHMVDQAVPHSQDIQRAYSSKQAGTNGRIVGHCDNCSQPVRYHTGENGVDELRHLHNNHNRCSNGQKAASLRPVAAFFDPKDASVRVLADGMTRARPTLDNPSGAGDEFDANTWNNAVTQRPMQSAEDRGINTPTQPREPIGTVSSEPGRADDDDRNQNGMARETSLAGRSIEELMES